MTEIQKTVEFVREQRLHSRNRRHWKRRLANFGFAIDTSDDGLVITALPDGDIVCPLPADLQA